MKWAYLLHSLCNLSFQKVYLEIPQKWKISSFAFHKTCQFLQSKTTVAVISFVHIVMEGGSNFFPEKCNYTSFL